jgi:hypothetical protein
MEFIAGILLIFGLALIIWGFIAFIRGIGKLLSSPSPQPRRPLTPASDEIDGMNNGDYYNGPHGYSPMTGYPETQYGSGFDPDAEWDHEERD